MTVWHIIAAGVCLGISAAFEMPAASALVPELVRASTLRSAIAVDRSIFHATRLGGSGAGRLAHGLARHGLGLLRQCR